MDTYKVESNQYFPYKGKRLPNGLPECKTYYYVSNQKNQTINKFTLVPYKGKEMNYYKFDNINDALSICNKLNDLILFQPFDRLLEPNEIGIRCLSKPDKENKSTFFLYWLSDQIGEKRNLTGNTGQIFYTNLNEKIEKLKSKNKFCTFI